MLTGATPAEHGMRSNFAPRLGVRAESIFDVLADHGRRGRLVGIAHLLDPFGEEVVEAVTSVQPTERIDRSLCAAARRVVEEEDPDLLVLQLLAADQLGHVRGVRNREYVEQLEQTDRHIGDFLAFLAERGKLDGATVVLMADHGQGRGIGGHGHLDWGESPVPFVVWGEGAVPGAAQPRAALGARAGGHDLRAAGRGAARRPRAAGRWCPSATPGSPRAPPIERCLAIVVARNEEHTLPGVLAGLPSEACGLPVDVLLVDDGSTDATPAIGRDAGAIVISHPRSRGLGAALRTGLEAARESGYGAAVYLDGDGEYDPADFERVLEPVARGRADYVLGSRFAGDKDGMSWHRNISQPRGQRPARLADGRHRDQRRPDRLPRASRPARSRPPRSATTTTTPRCSRCRSGAPASTPSRCRSPTAAAPTATASCATRSTSRAWRPRSGASGAPRPPPGPTARSRSRRPARTPRRRRRRTGTAR